MQVLFAAWLLSSLGAVVDALSFIGDHWKELCSIAAAVTLLVQQWRTAHAAKTAAEAAKVAATVAVKADNGAQVRDVEKSRMLKENTDMTRDTAERTKVIEKTTNGEKTARIEHIELLEAMLRDAGKPVPPKPSILG